MKFFSKGICAIFLLAFSLSSAHAQSVNFYIEGTVQDTWTGYYGPNPFGLSVGDTITATAVFDDSLIYASGYTKIEFSAPDIEMYITVGNTVYGDNDDSWGGADLWLYNGMFDGIDYSSSDWEFDSDFSCCGFGGYEFDGEWNSASMSITPVNAVPVPAAVWLFGSGLLGLVGFARRKAA